MFVLFQCPLHNIVLFSVSKKYNLTNFTFPWYMECYTISCLKVNRKWIFFICFFFVIIWITKGTSNFLKTEIEHTCTRIYWTTTNIAEICTSTIPAIAAESTTTFNQTKNSVRCHSNNSTSLFQNNWSTIYCYNSNEHKLYITSYLYPLYSIVMEGR